MMSKRHITTPTKKDGNYALSKVARSVTSSASYNDGRSAAQSLPAIRTAWQQSGTHREKINDEEIMNGAEGKVGKHDFSL